MKHDIRGTPEAAYFRRFLRAYISQPIESVGRGEYSALIGWEKYPLRNIRKYTASGPLFFCGYMYRLI